MKGNPAIYYCVYPPLLMAMTLLLTRTLHRIGAAAATQRRNEDADPISRRLIIGLVMVAAGYLALTLLMNNDVASTKQLIDQVLVRLASVRCSSALSLPSTCSFWACGDEVAGPGWPAPRS